MRHLSAAARTFPIANAEVVPFPLIADGVAGLRVLFVNVFAIRGETGWVLVDAGLYGSAGRIRAWARQHVDDAPPQAIVLTHGHFDHVGALNGLLDDWGAPVYAHRAELPYLTGARSYPPADPTPSGLMARMSLLYPRRPIDLDRQVHELPADGALPGLPEWRWLHTPGHTPGHVSLFRDADRTLIVGDAFCTTRQESFLAVATQQPEVHGPPAYFTADWDAACRSIARLAALEPACVAPGHGRALEGPQTRRALQALSARFERQCRPGSRTRRAQQVAT